MTVTPAQDGVQKLLILLRLINWTPAFDGVTAGFRHPGQAHDLACQRINP
jgi:hypothetical protein